MGAYDDIINLPHPASDRHLRMSMADRAAQFTPFAALSGQAVFTYFLSDEKKQGGRYVSLSGAIRKINGLEQRIVLTDGASIPIEDILTIEHQPTPAEEQRR